MKQPSLTPTDRSALLDELECTRFDVVVVGGGIAGAAVARDASARGLQVAVVEADDFAAGTSSRSSKLIHGGLRYLARGEVRFVRQIARERAVVHTMAPHLAQPCWMLLPTRTRAQAAGRRAGLGLYERLGAVARAERHMVWRNTEITDREPYLRCDPDDQVIAYREYLTDDARLVIAVLRAAASTGTVAANRVPVVGLVRHGNRIDGVVIRCAMTEREVQVRGRVVVNAAGPWVERIAAMEQDPPASRVHLSKGVHVVVPRHRLAVDHPILCKAKDKRWIFVVPRDDVVYIGTTDTSYHGDRSLWPEVTADDVRYLLDPLDPYFDVDPLTGDHVVATWAGVRSLIAHDGRTTRRLSRRSNVTVGPGGMISIIGGKLTGFRQMADHVVRVVADCLGCTLPNGPGALPLPGAGTLPPDGGPAHERLVRLYGSEAPSVVAMGAGLVVDGGSILSGEIDWAIDVEAALTLEDVLYRRTRAAWFVPAERERLAPAVAAHMARRLHWSEQRCAEELTGVQARFADELAFRLRPSPRPG